MGGRGGALRAKFCTIGSVLLVLALALIGPLGAGASAGAASPPTTYYLALGDSLSTGGGATPGASYVDDIYAAEKSRIPGLQLVNLGCAGDSTTRMIHGGLCTYTQGDQLGAAEAFLDSHVGSVKFVTIDVGGDDVDGCAPSGTINETCIQNGLQAVKTNMPIILGGIRAAGGNVPIVGMSYYDPWLAFYLHGASGQQAATASLGVLHQLNSDLRSSYKASKARVAAVQKAFDSWDTALTGSFDGQTLPQDVANICNWTHMCDPTDPTVHTNDTGHAIIAAAFEARLKLVS
jgi:lysophospholipase L1-like esterase